MEGMKMRFHLANGMFDLGNGRGPGGQVEEPSLSDAHGLLGRHGQGIEEAIFLQVVGEGI